MGNKERKIINDELLEGSKTGYRWRANAGKFLQGKQINPPPHIMKMLSTWMEQNGIKHKRLMILADYRYIQGLPEGFFDVFGWDDFAVCEYLKMRNDHFPCMKADDMEEGVLDQVDCDSCGLNIPVAVFVGVECKTPEDKLRPGQKKYRNILKKSGGIYRERREEKL